MDRDKSYIDHAPWCSSEQKVSKLELEHDPDFVKHVKLEKKATGGSCAKSALGRMGRVDGSVKVHTARRAQNCTKRCNLADYTHDFNKIKGWIRDYMEQNRESRAEVKVDHENRSVVRPQPFGLPGPEPLCSFVPRFQRMFVSVGPCIQVAYGVGMRFSAVDASFSKHTIWRDGYFHLLTTRDGDNRMLPLAWALCETESGDTYT